VLEAPAVSPLKTCWIFCNHPTDFTGVGPVIPEAAQMAALHPRKAICCDKSRIANSSRQTENIVRIISV
jgi:hypothetical protein